MWCGVKREARKMEETWDPFIRNDLHVFLSFFSFTCFSRFTVHGPGLSTIEYASDITKKRNA